ncbi:UNVERIFIED_CONTAM: hypothetical protein GTU68_049185 [Idotea baltica]|nr:hypothetical protein [Idotea baltica]
MAEEFGSVVHLLHVIEPVPAGALMSHLSKDELQNSMVTFAEGEMEKLHEIWKDYNFPVETIIKEGNPFVEIIGMAKELDVDLIVMGTHGRGAIAHALLGNVAEKTVRKAPCPVLTVRDPGHEFVMP